MIALQGGSKQGRTKGCSMVLQVWASATPEGPSRRKDSRCASPTASQLPRSNCRTVRSLCPPVFEDDHRVGCMGALHAGTACGLQQSMQRCGGGAKVSTVLVLPGTHAHFVQVRRALSKPSCPRCGAAFLQGYSTFRTFVLTHGKPSGLTSQAMCSSEHASMHVERRPD